jgi:hypothetical protein
MFDGGRDKPWVCTTNRKETVMARVIGVMCAIVAAVAVVGVANAASPSAWTAPKAERMLADSVKVQVPAPERAALEGELRYALLQYAALAHGAAELGDSQASLTYHRVADEYRRALRLLLDGIEVADAECAGSGKALATKRFRTFDCMVVSGVESIPTTELGSALDGDLPAVVRLDPRRVGPFMTWVRVRVTGKASFSYR